MLRNNRVMKKSNIEIEIQNFVATKSFFACNFNELTLKIEEFWAYYESDRIQQHQELKDE